MESQQGQRPRALPRMLCGLHSTVICCEQRVLCCFGFTCSKLGLLCDRATVLGWGAPALAPIAAYHPESQGRPDQQLSVPTSCRSAVRAPSSAGHNHEWGVPAPLQNGGVPCWRCSTAGHFAVRQGEAHLRHLDLNTPSRTSILLQGAAHVMLDPIMLFIARQHVLRTPRNCTAMRTCLRPAAVRCDDCDVTSWQRL